MFLIHGSCTYPAVAWYQLCRIIEVLLLCVQYTFIVCTVHVYCVYGACVLCVQCMCTVCTVHVYCVYSACVLVYSTCVLCAVWFKVPCICSRVYAGTVLLLVDVERILYDITILFF